jgi:hypothetical protein
LLPLAGVCIGLRQEKSRSSDANRLLARRGSSLEFSHPFFAETWFVCRETGSLFLLFGTNRTSALNFATSLIPKGHPGLAQTHSFA